MKPPNHLTPWRLIASTAVILSSSAITVRAANYTYSSTLNLASSTVVPDGAYEFNSFSFPGGQPTYTLNDGDTISGTISFANNQRLRILDSDGSHFEYLMVRFSPQGSSSSEVNTTIELLGVTGLLNGSNPQPRSNSGNTVVAALFFGITPSEVSFSGFNYSITLRPGNTGNNIYQPSDLGIYAAANSVSVIPEPSVWGLISVVTLGICGFRKRGSTV